MLDFVTYKMKILITSATSKLSQQLTTDLSADHQIRLTDLVDFETDFDFVQSDLGHESETDELVKDIDTIIHLATLPLALLENPDDLENLEIDFLTRCTYNLLYAAVAQNISNFVFASTLQLFAKLDQNLTIGPNWRPRPTTDLFPLSRHLGEFVCREFAREGQINVSIIRLGDTIDEDTIGAFRQAINSTDKWKITHI
ncbi:TPA: NAD(P)-dependent oxidoreductase [Candidatus Poribacteria bacterium]|nr:NAD(P)-dependent oxidoreductase [Candidatus Poribacteria bacterium]HIC20224.1 NAD(P)-dependent oxidoreductase [Candidatus Poribacteria bacterium]HIN31795.1 NAD(P)-dependent oxidoreductase [Candidatus Poribacteria bacterium]HIO06840.1 NAD(P)-dependent oxidoreductase [Candidatus Poribacteria bacterium]